MPTSKLTITDVAQAAGVSVSTVSRILNNKDDVAEKTREHVQAVIDDLGYRPLLGARQLRDRKSRNLGLLFPLNSQTVHAYNAFDMEFILGASIAAGEHSYLLSLVTNPIDDKTLLNYYQSFQFDGVALMHVHVDDWRADLLREHDHPFVMIGHCDENYEISYIDLDHENSVVKAFEFLIELGHSQIGFITFDSEIRESGFGPAVRSWRGYERVTRFYGVPSLYREVMRTGEATEQATLSLLDEQPKMTAIVSLRATTVSSVLSALVSRNKVIPQDCSVVAVMNERLAHTMTPSMTRIHFPAYEIGYNAIHTLIRQLDGEVSAPEQVLIPPQLVVGASTSAPAHATTQTEGE